MYYIRGSAGPVYVLVTVRRRVVHFTFHILRRTAGGRRRRGNVAVGPHSFRIKQRRRRSSRRRSVGRMRGPRSAHRTRCAPGEISLCRRPTRPRTEPRRTPSIALADSPAHPRAVRGVTENRLRGEGVGDRKNNKNKPRDRTHTYTHTHICGDEAGKGQSDIILYLFSLFIYTGWWYLHYNGKGAPA